MEKIKLIVLLFSLNVYSQAESVVSLDLISIEKIGDSLSKNNNFLDAYKLYEILAKTEPDNFNYNYKYAGSYGSYVESLPRFQQVKHIKKMINQFETTYNLKNNHLGVNRALLEIYLRVPRLFGGGNKKAKIILDNIYSFSVDEGKKAEIFYNSF